MTFLQMVVNEVPREVTEQQKQDIPAGESSHHNKMSMMKQVQHMEELQHET